MSLMTEDERAAQATIIHQVIEERTRQDKQWGGPPHDDYHSRRDWVGFIEEHAERARKSCAKKTGSRSLEAKDPDEYRKQLVEIAALAIAAVAAHDRARKVGK